MKAVLMCGSHKRHIYLAERLYQAGILDKMIIEEREDFVPSPPEGLCKQDRDNFILHFKNREEAEEKYFGKVKKEELLRNVEHIKVSRENLTGEDTLNFLKKCDKKYLFSYGVHKLTDEVLDLFPDHCFNIHGGLSPWYKGNTTLFWPFYFLEPNWAGMTIHRLSRRLDGGDILHHSVPILEYGDRIHDVACKAVIAVAEDLCKIARLEAEGKELKCVPQTSNGKLFLGRDWSPQMLRVIYNLFQDDIVDQYLDGNLLSDNPKLVRQF